MNWVIGRQSINDVASYTLPGGSGFILSVGKAAAIETTEIVDRLLHKIPKQILSTRNESRKLNDDKNFNPNVGMALPVGVGHSGRWLRNAADAIPEMA